MELKYSSKERLAGVFVICSVLLLIITLVIIGRGKDWFKKYVLYYTTFEESYNVQADTAVKLLDTNIGKVKNVSLLGDRVRVELLILEDYTSRIRTGAVATVGSPTFIGSEYVSIKPGKDKNAPLIPEGGLIPSSPRRSISVLLEEFEVEKTAKMIVKAAQDISALVHTFRDPGGPLFRILNDLAATIVQVEQIAQGLQAGDGTAGSILKSNRIGDAIHENLNNVGAILDHIETTTATLPRKADQIDSILEQVHAAAGKSPAVMEKVQSNLETIQAVGNGLVENITHLKAILSEVNENLDAVKVILNNLEQASFDVPKVTRATTEGIKEVRQSVENIDKVVESLQQNFLIRPNLPPEPVGKNTDAGLRE